MRCTNVWQKAACCGIGLGVLIGGVSVGAFALRHLTKKIQSTGGETETESSSVFVGTVGTLAGVYAIGSIASYFHDPLFDFKTVVKEFKLFTSVLREDKCVDIIRSTARFGFTGPFMSCVGLIRPFFTVGCLAVAYHCYMQFAQVWEYRRIKNSQE